MKILHTSDWHLGKYLEGQSRLEEQEKFIGDFIEIVEENDIDLIIIAGDIYDTSNPPAKAEKLFYESVKTLSNEGERIVLIIAGNHDNPERLGSSKPLATEQGIILLGKPKDTIEVGKIGQHEIVDSGEGFLELKIRDENAVVGRTCRCWPCCESNLVIHDDVHSSAGPVGVQLAHVESFVNYALTDESCIAMNQNRQNCVFCAESVQFGPNDTL